MPSQVPPALNRFTKAIDKNTAQNIFKLLLKYRPEDKAAKKERLLREAEAREQNKTVSVASLIGKQRLGSLQGAAL